MSDKNQPEQENAKQDSKTTASSSSAEHLENQQGLSASINLTASEKNSVPENKTDTDTKKTKTSTIAKTKEKSKPSVNKSSAASSAKTSATKAAETPNKLSKTAVFALLIALLAIAASLGHYFWAEQQKAQFAQQLNTEFQKQLQLNQAQVSKQLQQQGQQNSAQLKALESAIQGNTLDNISELQQALAQVKQQVQSLNQNQPSDWLLHEAEYLIRVASRTLWLEKDTTAAIGLLVDAEQRIQELNDPQYLPLRQIIQQDIASLQLLPKLNTDEVILKLMALTQQIEQLALAMVKVPSSDENTSDLELSESTTDWRENLAKSWRKFTADFITVRRRTGNVEPLMSPAFQQNLRENLNLKLQTAIWAASKGNSDIYRQSLADINLWINEYFDMTTIASQNFTTALQALESETINVSYPNKLSSLTVIRDLLNNDAALIAPVNMNDKEVKKSETDMPEPAAEQSSDATKQDEEA